MGPKGRKPPTVQVFEGLSGQQTAEAFLDGLRSSGDLVQRDNDLWYWHPPREARQFEVVYADWMLRLVAYELETRNAPVEAELRRRGLM